MDRLRKELYDCSRLARTATNHDDRMFWERAAQRWKALIKEFEKPPVAADERKTIRPAKTFRSYGTFG